MSSSLLGRKMNSLIYAEVVALGVSSIILAIDILVVDMT